MEANVKVFWRVTSNFIKLRVSSFNHGSIISLLLILVGCSVTQDYQPPAIEVKEDWRISYETSVEYANLPWWENFKDPILNNLIKEAVRNNNDLLQATAVLNEVVSNRQLQLSKYYPQVFLQGGLEKYQRSLEQPISQSQRVNRVSDSYQLSLNTAWEIDIWGRLALVDKAALADLMAAEEVRRGVIMTLVTSVA